MHRCDSHKAKLSDDQVHQAVMERLRKMTDSERIQALIDAGILTDDGEMAKPYRTVPSLSYCEPLPKRQ